jgi:hypothetical protein
LTSPFGTLLELARENTRAELTGEKNRKFLSSRGLRPKCRAIRAEKRGWFESLSGVAVVTDSDAARSRRLFTRLSLFP